MSKLPEIITHTHLLVHWLVSWFFFFFCSHPANIWSKQERHRRVKTIIKPLHFDPLPPPCVWTTLFSALARSLSRINTPCIKLKQTNKQTNHKKETQHKSNELIWEESTRQLRNNDSEIKFYYIQQSPHRWTITRIQIVVPYCFWNGLCYEQFESTTNKQKSKTTRPEPRAVLVPSIRFVSLSFPRPAFFFFWTSSKQTERDQVLHRVFHSIYSLTFFLSFSLSCSLSSCLSSPPHCLFFCFVRRPLSCRVCVCSLPEEVFTITDRRHEGV